MTKRDPQTGNHLPNDLLVRAMDDELFAWEAAEVEAHLSHCDGCRQRYQNLRDVSMRIDDWAACLLPTSSVEARELLVRKLESRQSQMAAPAPSKVLRRFGWGMAIAASLALGVIFAPHGSRPSRVDSASISERPAIDSFEVNGETFAALPYSNPDLPISSSHIVQMQIPVSSLTDAGVAFGPVAMQETALNHSVLADVLIGMDGQPLGVHVLSAQ